MIIIFRHKVDAIRNWNVALFCWDETSGWSEIPRWLDSYSRMRFIQGYSDILRDRESNQGLQNCCFASASREIRALHSKKELKKLWMFLSYSIWQFLPVQHGKSFLVCDDFGLKIPIISLNHSLLGFWSTNGLQLWAQTSSQHVVHIQCAFLPIEQLA